MIKINSMPSSAVMKKEDLFYSVLEKVFFGKLQNIEGTGATVKLMRLKSNYYKSWKDRFKSFVEEVLKEFSLEENFKEELFDKLYNFFKRYFTESGSIVFARTPLHNQVYEKIYTDERDVVLFYKTRDCYYIKTEKVFHSMEFEYKGYKVVFDASQVEGKRGNEKRQVIFELKNAGQNRVEFRVQYKEGNRETKKEEILKGLKSAGIKWTEEDLEEVFESYRAQTEIDFFLHKRPREFLREQFDLWLYNYSKQDKPFSPERINELNAIRKVAYFLIDLIARFEEELVKIWLKPRFVLNSNYVISLDRIAKKGGWHIIEKLQRHSGWQAQVKEWIDLGILEKEPDSLVEEDLMGKRLKKEYQFLPIDTRYFKDLEAEILSLFEDLDSELDGWLIKSENFQALNTILPKFKGKVQTIYIDPPYNTGSDEFIYADRFKLATWLTMLENRLRLARKLLREDGVIFVSIANNSDAYCFSYELGVLLKEIFPKRFGDIIWKRRTGSGSHVVDDFIEIHEYVYVFGMEKSGLHRNLLPQEKLKAFKEMDEKGLYKWQSLVIHRNTKEERPNLFYGVVYNFVKNALDFDKDPAEVNPEEEVAIYPSEDGKSVWAMTKESMKEVYKRGVIGVIRKKDRYEICIKKYMYDSLGFINGEPLRSILEDRFLPWKVGGTSDATRELRDMFGKKVEFKTAKPVNLIKTLLYVSTGMEGIVLDFFAGSGTTGEAVIRLNKEYKRKLKFILIETGEHFEKLIIPRIKKLCYCHKWKDGKPQNSEGYSVFVKYYNLEQFEDIIERLVYRDEEECSEYETRLCYAVDIDFVEDRPILRFSRLYPSIDKAESISLLTGSFIRRFDEYSVTMADGNVYDFEDIRWWRSFIWW